MTDDDFLELGCEHALHGSFYLVDAVVNDAIHTHIDIRAGGIVTGSIVGSYIEADNDCTGGRRQHDIGLIYCADAAVDDLYAHFLICYLLKGSLDGLGRALNIGLDDDVEGLHLAGLDLTEQILEADLLVCAEGCVLLLDLALLNKFTGHALIGNGVEGVAGAGDLGHTGYLNGYGRSCFGYAHALVVYHRADTADSGTGNDYIAELERAVLDENCHDGTTTLVKASLDDSALCGTVRICLELLNLGENDKVFKQIVDAHTGLCGNGANNGITAPLLGYDIVLGELLLDAFGVSADGVHLIYCNDKRDARCLCVVYTFNGLRHYAVVRRDNKDGDIGDHRTSCTHGGKRLMTRSVEEGDGTAVNFNGICADVLGDAACLAGSDICMADIVEQ